MFMSPVHLTLFGRYFFVSYTNSWPRHLIPSNFPFPLLMNDRYAAPASNDSVCINGQTGVQDPDTDVCCPLECGDQCGGDNCGTIPGVNASQCCSTQIIASGAVCSDTVLPPCVVVASEFRIFSPL